MCCVGALHSNFNRSTKACLHVSLGVMHLDRQCSAFFLSSFHAKRTTGFHIHRVSLHAAKTAFSSSTVDPEPATAPPDPPAVRCLERLAAKKKERVHWIGLGLAGTLSARKHQSASYQSTEGRIDSVQIPTVHCTLSVDVDAELMPRGRFLCTPSPASKTGAKCLLQKGFALHG
ncbi:uncharacterized protein TrAFT101_005770 [Trichoderma asperellum]|uniref:Uncharacterized protein n=1 Tax=Trichoderma asperellum (strain ATCC 204424 / CBS 433.97 / NBRC 101777) TaxID=1042311 RepID=A0A2T3Z735_TRIA4|nr:hypothetical protein M441DRAFT_58092 [Trichoderma asperellum CBS 433.97]PTB40595.1 hypothetical protein M441DRAFT_58092 [Trichoderma asperellum CBS 433.97]UKZ90772.1 hypothetical protein TrAFT101_005770 [Trichoderma asperellum]